MPKICYREQSFYEKSLERLGWIENILEEYAHLGHRMTVRQVFYQAVARDLMPNTQATYNAIQTLLDNGRMTGRIDWEAIEDRGREVVRPSVWKSPSAILDACTRSYQRDLWLSQAVRVELIIEKAALVGVVEDVCQRFRVSYLAARGYASQSIAWEMAQRYRHDRREIVVLYLGDHDPSGIQMGRDLHERLELFADRKIDFRRLALNRDQTSNLPPNFAKETDKRFAKYVEEFGTEECWELDALEPDVIENLVETEIHGLIDGDRWAEVEGLEAVERQRLRRIAGRAARRERLA